MTYVKPDPPSAYAIPPFVGAEDLACRKPGVDPEIFFSQRHDPGNADREAEAKRLCRACPRRWECLEWALETGQTVGIYGAYTPKERKRMLAQRPTPQHVPERTPR